MNLNQFPSLFICILYLFLKKLNGKEKKKKKNCIKILHWTVLYNNSKPIRWCACGGCECIESTNDGAGNPGVANDDCINSGCWLAIDGRGNSNL